MSNYKLVSKEEYIEELINRANYDTIQVLCKDAGLRKSLTIKELRESLMEIESIELERMGVRLFYGLLQYRIESKTNNEECINEQL